MSFPQTSLQPSCALQGSSLQALPDTNVAVFENRLAAARLGIAAALFNAIRAKSPPLAAHGLRVAIGCSAWCTFRGMPAEQRDRLEVAALLHDIGAIGFPDRILKKPGPLTVEERMMVDLQGHLGAEILRGCCTDDCMLTILETFRQWYRNRRDGSVASISQMLEAKMLAIVEAFDAMTNDQVYRPAMTHAAAITELQRAADSQFDPDLVEEYCGFLTSAPDGLHGSMVSRWLHQLRQDNSDRIWGWNHAERVQRPFSVQLYQQVIERALDPTILVDRECTIIGWNSAAQAATGIPADVLIGSTFLPSLVGMCTESGEAWPDHACPLSATIRTCAERQNRVFHRVNGTQHRLSQMYVWPLQDNAGNCFGAVAVFRANNANDGLASTPLANDLVPPKKLRDAIEEAIPMAEQHAFCVLEITGFDSLPQSLIDICRQRTRSRDLIGMIENGRLFVLWPGCEERVARERGEQIQTAWNSIASNQRNLRFHLTRVQPDDDFDSVMHRLAHSPLSGEVVPTVNNLIDWLDGSSDTDEPMEIRLVTPVTKMLTSEKLRGFISDHQAEIIDVAEDRVQLRMAVMYSTGGRRRSDRRADFNVAIQLSRLESKHGGTVIHVVFQPVKVRDRRSTEMRQCAQQIIVALRSYLMADLAG